tara:strand:+ start:41 stop:148 length:108 start_codon:yes stop_codon:yes gene_type:complete
MKKINKLYQKALPTIYLAPFFFGAYTFVSFIQWSS